MKEETPEQRKRVLILGWTFIAVVVLICLAMVLSFRSLEQEKDESQKTNAPTFPQSPNHP